jgi:hypothetical protein
MDFSKEVTVRVLAIQRPMSDAKKDTSALAISLRPNVSPMRLLIVTYQSVPTVHQESGTVLLEIAINLLQNVPVLPFPSILVIKMRRFVSMTRRKDTFVSKWNEHLVATVLRTIIVTLDLATLIQRRVGHLMPQAFVSVQKKVDVRTDTFAPTVETCLRHKC